MYTTEEIESIRTEARKHGLDAGCLFRETPAEYLVQICNGCGDASMPEKIRELLTWLYRNYAPAHCIHDCDFEASDGTDEGLEAANDRFNANCVKLWQARYGAWRWVNPAALWGRNKIRLAYKALRLYSDKAWQAAYQRRLANECTD